MYIAQFNKVVQYHVPTNNLLITYYKDVMPGIPAHTCNPSRVVEARKVAVAIE